MGEKTITITTTNKHKIVIKNELTWGELQTIQDEYVRNIDIDGDASMQSFSGEVMIKARNKAIETVVVSIDGKSDHILSTFYQLPQADGNEMMDKINSITQTYQDTEKKTK